MGAWQQLRSTSQQGDEDSCMSEGSQTPNGSNCAFVEDHSSGATGVVHLKPQTGPLPETPSGLMAQCGLTEGLLLSR